MNLPIHQFSNLKHRCYEKHTFQEGVWIWVRTGKQVEFTAWCLGQPDNSLGENCLHLWYDTCELKWNDNDCFNDNIKPICQK